MADTNKHIINRINTDIHCRQRDLNRVQQLGLAPRLAQFLEQLSPFLDRKFGDRTVKLEALTIELDIKNNQLSNLGNLLTGALAEALEKIEGQHKGVSKPNYRVAKDLPPDEVFLYFLRVGQMPWFSAKLEFEKIDFSSQSFKTKLAKTLQESLLARERLVHQFTVQQLQSMLLTLYPNEFIKPLFKFRSLLHENTGDYSERFAAGHKLGQQLLIAALHFLQDGREPSLAKFLFNYSTRFVEQIQTECNGKHYVFLKFIRTELAARFKIETVLFDRKEEAYVTDGDKMRPTIDSAHRDRSKSLDHASKEAENKELQMALNAGTILLHPFLTRFFNIVGLLENNKFISAAHQQRAICLLHNLATGELVFPEEKLLFFKYVCNYPLHHPVPRELPISDFELEEVQTVLNSAITHWTALKRTSVEGLRLNFLQRKGLLEQDALGYTLHVESHTADILLEQLPWGLSTIHLPWHPDLLTIKWR